VTCPCATVFESDLQGPVRRGTAASFARDARPPTPVPSSCNRRLQQMSREFHRRRAIGAEVTGGGVHFRVWAPARNRVDVVMETTGETFALKRESTGHFSGFAEGIGAGARYRFLLDGNDGPFPDPASGFSPKGRTDRRRSSIPSRSHGGPAIGRDSQTTALSSTRSTWARIRAKERSRRRLAICPSLQTLASH